MAQRQRIGRSRVVLSLHTVQCRDRIKLDLRVQEGLDGGGDVIGMIMAVFSMAMPAMIVVVMMPRHGEDGMDVRVGCLFFTGLQKRKGAHRTCDNRRIFFRSEATKTKAAA